MVIIVNYGLGNLGSLLNMCKHVGIKACISGDADEISKATHLILPGVGAFDTGMRKLHQSGLVDSLTHSVLVRKTPILGVCLGMQLMAKKSEEGTEIGLGWIDAEVKRIPASEEVKVPHMGWNQLVYRKKCKLFSGDKDERFYFVHSYYVHCNERDDVTATSFHGVSLDAAFSKANIWGVQFHPEKSHRHGSQLIKSFFEIE